MRYEVYFANLFVSRTKTEEMQKNQGQPEIEPF